MDQYVIFHIEGGCGKNIIATSVCASIKAAYPDRKLIVVTGYPEVFLHNPNVYRVYKFGMIPYFYEDYILNKDTRILRNEPYHSEDLLYRRKSLSQIWCDSFDIPCVTEEPKIYIANREQRFISDQVKKDGPILVIQTSGGAENQGHSYSWSRDLPQDFAQDVVNAVKDDYERIYHVRRDDQPALENTLQAKDMLRVLFGLFAISDSFLCMDSMVQHAAAALGKKATVGWISNSPVVFGHSVHNNIIANDSDSFRHRIDSYLESDDWTGGRFHECPFEEDHILFNQDDFVKSILSTKTGKYVKKKNKAKVQPHVHSANCRHHRCR